jgi:hypothetical protein
MTGNARLSGRKEVTFMGDGLKSGPSFEHKFKTLVAQEIMKEALGEGLGGQPYVRETASQTAREICEAIKAKLKEVIPPQYKIIVQVLLGEHKGQGIAMGFRGFWDQDCDDFARETYTNDSMFAVAVCYAMYSY